jgi:integrase
MRLTTTTIKTLALPAGVSDRIYFDDTLPGFGLRLRASGAASWIVQYDVHGKTKKFTLGTPTVLDPNTARNKARNLLASIRLGGDPAKEKQQAKQQAAETFGALLVRAEPQGYLAIKQAKSKAGSRTFKEAERHLVKYAKALHRTPVKDVDRRAVSALVAAVASKNGPIAANNMLGTLSGYFTWLIREGLIDVNPASYANKAVANGPRDRVLAPEEYRTISTVLGDSDYADIFRVLAYTGARKTEIGSLRFDEIDFEKGVIELPASRTKNSQPHVIPLVPQVLAILQARPANGREFVFGYGRGFTGWAWAKRALDARTGPMPAWVLHDLRRFVSTNMHDKLGVAPHVVEAILGHIAGFKSGVAGVYNKASYLDERRRALEKWAAYLDEIVSGKRAPAKVVAIGPRQG